MKKIFYSVFAFVSIALTSCIGDVENINPQQTSEADYDAIFNKVYATFVLTGQVGPSDDGDLIGLDEGRSQYTRMLWNLNELTSDEAHWYWYQNDAGYEDLVQNTYGADNAVSSGLFYRLFFNITLCNNYLTNVPDGSATDLTNRKNEVRFIRAFFYWSLIDLFGNGPFSDKFEVGTGGEYKTRAELFTYVESELKDLAEVLPAAGSQTYGRVDQVAAWMMLSRIYLNAEVYTGTARWAEAKEWAAKVINNGYYKLLTTGKNGYTPYQLLFMADNDTNGAQYEDIFPILHNGTDIKSYGGMHALILGNYSANMSTIVPSGTGNSWGKCATIKGRLADIFFGNAETDGKLTDLNAAYTLANNDQRALIINVCGEDKYTRYVETQGDQTQGYCCVKFRNVRSDGGSVSPEAADGYVDTDYPLLRIAEAYLNYAEADARINGGATTADGGQKINALRNRANATIYKTDGAGYTLEEIRDEWAKEFWFEGRRRIDLVRFGCFGGQSSYKWEWMGNAAGGNQFAAFRNIFGIPNSEITINTAIKQNEGY